MYNYLFAVFCHFYCLRNQTHVAATLASSSQTPTHTHFANEWTRRTHRTVPIVPTVPTVPYPSYPPNILPHHTTDRTIPPYPPYHTDRTVPTVPRDQYQRTKTPYPPYHTDSTVPTVPRDQYQLPRLRTHRTIPTVPYTHRTKRPIPAYQDSVPTVPYRLYRTHRTKRPIPATKTPYPPYHTDCTVYPPYQETNTNVPRLRTHRTIPTVPYPSYTQRPYQRTRTKTPYPSYRTVPIENVICTYPCWIIRKHVFHCFIEK